MTVQVIDWLIDVFNVSIYLIERIHETFEFYQAQCFPAVQS